MITEHYMFTPIRKNLIETPGLAIITIPTLLLGSWAFYSFISDYSNIKLLYFLLGYLIINIIGVTAGLHRYYSHKTFTVSKWKERFMLWAATLAGQGSPVWWTALHRGYHHKHSDTNKDFHSPIHGFWHSFILWIFRINQSSVNFKYAADVLRNKDAVWFSTHYTKIWVISNIAFALISFDFFLYFSMMASLITLLTYNLANSLTHYSILGYTNFKTRDNSTNVPWLFPIILGECWHNNHHARPGNKYFGIKWWEIDPAGLFIKIFEDIQ
jgi:fatty-acid desaturase